MKKIIFSLFVVWSVSIFAATNNPAKLQFLGSFQFDLNFVNIVIINLF